MCTGLCDAGYYGASNGLTDSTCTDLCDAGYYGSADSVRTASTCSGLCDAGYYGSADSVRANGTCSGSCDAGYFGATAGLTTSTCTGLCDAGHYGSTIKTISVDRLGHSEMDSKICTGFLPSLGLRTVWLRLTFTLLQTTNQCSSVDNCTHGRLLINSATLQKQPKGDYTRES